MANLWDDFLSFMPSGSTVGNAVTSSIPTLVRGGLDVYSAQRTQDANTRAAQIAQQGTDRAINAYTAANDRNQAMLTGQRQQTQPGVSYLRSVVGSNPGNLTPGQQTGLDIARNTAQTQLATSGLRGAGQAQLDVLRGLDKSYIGDAVAANTARADTAGSTLAGENAMAVPTSAYLNAGTAGQVGAASERGSLYPAQATTSNAAVAGQSMGDISSLIAGQNKARLSRYAGTSGNPARAGTGSPDGDGGSSSGPMFAMGGRIAAGVEDRYATRLRGGLHYAGGAAA